MEESLPACGREFDGNVCQETGEHFCAPRADHVQAFCEEIATHTKDVWAGKPFVLADWQRDDIIRPLFGNVVWSSEHQRYVRRYRIGWIEISRKNGKSELLAVIALYLLIGDGVQGSEVYGCVHPDTPVLCDDLTWRPISALRPGDRIVGMDEHPEPKRFRKLRTATVVDSWPTRKQAVKLTLANGREVVCSADHRWMWRSEASNRRIWRPAHRIAVGEYLLDIFDPWTVGTSFEHGYLAGLYDGEGSFHAPLREGAQFRINFSQKPGHVLDQFRAIMQDLRIPVAYSKLEVNGAVIRECVYELRNVLRILGEIRPVRLLARHKEIWEGRSPKGRWARVDSIEHLGETDLWDIETTTGTYFADGMLSHNCAGDRDQARKVWDVADRMVALSPVLARRLRTFRQAKRIVDERTGSYYEIVAADAKGNLGHNPHGVVFDEVLTQPDGALWDAMRTAMGTRVEPLMVAATTAGNDDASFAKTEHDECERIQDDPGRAPHRFVYLRNTPADADPFDEANWPFANPALGDFLSLQALRDEALEAKNEPAKENTFRQYRLNQWVKQSTRWMPMHLYDRCAGTEWTDPHRERKKLEGRVAWAGFDLSAKFDLTAWCLLLPPKNHDEGPVEVLWRFWLPETGLHDLDKHAGGKFAQWAKAGWVTVTDGDVIDYQTVYTDIAEDAKRFDLRGADCDQWSMFPVIQEIGKRTGLRDEQLVAYANTFDKMTPGMTELMALVRAGRFEHHGNPVARYCFDACEVRHATNNPDLIRPDKPARDATGKRVDAVIAAALACAAWSTRGRQKPKKRRVAGF